MHSIFFSISSLLSTCQTNFSRKLRTTPHSSGGKVWEVREAFYSPVSIISIFLVRLHLWTVNVTCTSQSSPPPLSLLPSVGQDGYNGLELVIFLPASQLGFDKTPADEALVKQFLLRAGLVKNRIFLIFQRVPFSLPEKKV